jgi:quercetin dioxygenase-like cupin family protein
MRRLALVVAFAPLAVLAGTLAAAPAHAPDALDAARPFYKLILENDAVRVFESSIPPGQTAPAHHLGCRVMYALAPMEVRTTSLEGVTVESRKPFRAAWWRAAEDQAVTNIGAKNAFSLVVEFKGMVPGGKGCSDAVAPAPAAVWATPTNMTWATDDKTGVARVRVIGSSADAGPFIQRTRLPANYKGERHAHSARIEATVLSGELRMRFDGNDQEVVLPAGSFVTVPAGLVHSETTVGGAEFEMRGEGPMATTQVK